MAYAREQLPKESWNLSFGGSGFRVYGLWFRARGVGFRVQGLGH